MNTKFNLKKLLLIVGILLISMCVFCTSVAQASDVMAGDIENTEGTETQGENNKETVAPAENQEENNQETTTPAENEGENSQETVAPAENEGENKQETTATVESQNVNKQETATESKTEKVNLTKEAVLAAIPDTFELEMSEGEVFVGNYYGFAETILEGEINTYLFDNADIDLNSQTNIRCFVEVSLENVRKATVEIYDSTQEKSVEKEISIKYSNSDDYNEKDAEDIKNKVNNIKFNQIVEENMEINYSDAFWGEQQEKLQAEVKEALGDDSIVVAYRFAVGASNMSACGSVVFFAKNNIVYCAKELNNFIIPTLIIPENIEDTDEAYMNYALPKIKEYYSKNFEYDVDNFEKVNDNTVVYGKGLECENNGLLYKVTLSTKGVNENDWACVMLRKEKTNKVIDHITVDETSGVTIRGTKIPETSEIYSEMKAKAKEKGYTNIYNVYEFKLVSGNMANGVKVTFDLGTANNGKEVIVLHKKADGNYEEFVRTIKDGKIDITVKELSPFLIASKTNLEGSRVLDNEPNTGVENYTLIVSIIATISLAGIVALKIKK